MARRRHPRRDPWNNTSVLDAVRVARALRHERGGESAGLVETSAELLVRLGFSSVAEMEAWSERVRERV